MEQKIFFYFIFLNVFKFQDFGKDVDEITEIKNVDETENLIKNRLNNEHLKNDFSWESTLEWVSNIPLIKENFNKILSNYLSLSS